VVAKTTKGQSQKIQLYDYTAALIVGIDRYENLGASEQLTYAVKDAKGVEKVLRDGFQFDEIITLYNEQATRDKIMQALYGFRSLTPDGGVFVYFAGHGITIPGTLSGKDLGYLVPYDGSLDLAEMYKNISMQQVKSDICVSISAKHVFFVFDACFAGLMLDTRATLSKPSRDFSYLKAITDEQVRQVLTAGAKGETVLDGGPGGHSVFTGRLIQALENTEDYITARELGQYLKKRVYGDTAARGHTQRPVDGEIYGTGDFVFVPDLEKRGMEISAEVDALEAEITRLKRLKENSAKARDQSRKREIERLQFIKEAELKQAQMRKRQKEEAVKHQRKAAAEVEQLEKDRKQRESENEQRLAMLRIQADKMRQELSQDLAGGATIESAVAELRRIKEQRDKIHRDFSTELEKQTEGLSTFYDKKISRIMDTPPWDKEFETKEDYRARVAETERKATPVRQAKEQRLTSLRHEMETTRDDQTRPLARQMKELEGKRFILPASQVSFKFVKYYLKSQMMLGSLFSNEITEKFIVSIPKRKAREYKYNPELLVPEVHMKVTLIGPKLDRVIFCGPENGERYTALPGVDISDDGRFIDNGDETVTDRKTGLMWAAKDNGEGITWQDAKSYCENYRGAGYKDWRMPTQDELASLYDPNTQNKAGYHATRLLDITSCCPWASERRESMAAYVSFSSGGDRDWNRASGLNYGFARALPVRSRSDEIASLPQKPSNSQSSSSTSNVIKQDGVYVAYANEIVRDTRTGLEWRVGPDKDTTWDEARSWVQSLNLDGGGWRMPTMDELEGLYKEDAGNRNMTPLLKTTGLWVWTGATKGSSDAWLFYFDDGGRHWYGRNIYYNGRAFAVRSRGGG